MMVEKIMQLFRRKPVAVSPSVASVGVISAEPAHAKESAGEVKVIMAALMLTMFLSALDQTIVSTALPQIAVDLHGLDKLSWVATAYLLASAIATPIYGKLGDMYGRKKIFMVSVFVFLLGSVLCGLSQNIEQLIMFRAVQGLGGGGLMALILAIIAEVVSPRQRGKFQGYFGAVFGISSIAGPLLGGLFTEHLSWHWIFYINLPLGVLALWAISTYLHLPVRRSPHRIDYAGAALLSLASVGALLISVWGGVEYAWGSSQILGLATLTVVSVLLFLWRERQAKEPIIPLGLFKNHIFISSVLLSVLSGIAMFASILYIPQYQQIVRGYSPTESGLLMLPLVLGLLTASIVSGRLTSKTGRYKIFPIIGTLLLVLGLWLFSHLSLTTGHVAMSVWMLIIGAGLGLFMQISTLAVQNSTAPEKLGVATSTVTFFRSMGGSLGGAIFGTVLVSRLTHYIQSGFPQLGNVAGMAKSSGLTQIPPEARQVVLQSYVSSFHDMFLLAIPFALAAFVVAVFMREVPLRDSHAAHK